MSLVVHCAQQETRLYLAHLQEKGWQGAVVACGAVGGAVCHGQLLTRAYLLHRSWQWLSGRVFSGSAGKGEARRDLKAQTVAAGAQAAWPPSTTGVAYPLQETGRVSHRKAVTH